MATATVVAVSGDTALHNQDREMSMGARLSPRLESTTPTHDSLAGLSAQRPLPDEPLLSGTSDANEHRHKRSDSFASSRLTTRDMDDDVDMDDADADTAVEDDASDNESATSERPSKKKKGQRFFCTEFPPCQLSFTRSEHLARHIRKHTGERPFQCHCSRRFSRLDNLRQHAQTVHVNEEIPGDSLAATSTRFQRQIRTDRVKSGSRPRTSAANTPPAPHPRGHSRNLSTSSIASTSSFADEPRSRPPPLAIATGSKRASGHMDDYEASPHSYFPQSGLSTPTSQSFSAVGTPSYTPGYASPASAISRSSYYGGAGAGHTRRLSVPTGPNPFQQPMHPAAYYTPMSSQASVYSATSGYASPTSSIYSHGRRDSETEVEYRRRTWHPSTASTTQRPATSGLSYHQTPDEPRPALSQQPAASQVTRLPGIESFDHVSPSTPRQPASPMVVDARPPTSDRHEPGLYQNFHRLEIATNHNSSAEQSFQPPRSATRAYVPASQFSPQSQIRHQHHISMPEVPITPRKNKRQAWYGGPISPVALQQPPLAARPSPEDSGSSDGAPTPLPFQGQEYHPAIVNHEQPHTTHHVMPATIEEQDKAHQFTFPARPSHHSTQPHEHQQKPAQLARADSGFQAFAPNTAIIAPRPPLPPSPYERYMTSHMDNPPTTHAGNDMGRLEALVAVATSENRAAENQR